MNVISGRVVVGGRFEVVGQVGKVPCKLEVEFVTKSAHSNLNYITSDVRDKVVGSFPPANFSHDNGTLDFADIDLVVLCQELIEKCEIFSCVLVLNGVQSVSSTQFQPFN